MNKLILILLLSFLIISCSNDRNSTPQQNNIEQTPEALNEDKKLDISSYRKRYDSDIIKKLFDEAVENNESLKSLTSNLAKAKEFNIPREKWVYLHGCADAYDHWFIYYTKSDHW